MQSCRGVRVTSADRTRSSCDSGSVRHDRAHAVLHPVGANRLAGATGLPQPRDQLADDDVQFSSFRIQWARLRPERATTGEELRAEAASGEDEFTGGCTAYEGHPYRMRGFRAGEPLLRRLCMGYSEVRSGVI
jgi:hypothetical protein